MPLQFKNSEGQVLLGCLGGINYCLFLYCGLTSESKLDSLKTAASHDLPLRKPCD